MQTQAPPAAAIRAVRQRQRRLPLAQLLFAAAAVAVLLICGAYALRFVSATSFHKERAFRVLDEIGGQLDNLQRTLANQLRLMPPELAGRQCAKEFNGEAPGNGCKEKREIYQRRLALQGPKVDVASVNKELFKRACGQTSRYGTALRGHEPGVPFAAFSCAAQTQPGEEGQLLAVAFVGSMAETIQSFVSQSFFDEVLVTLSDGTVVATVPLRAESRATEVLLHPAKVPRLGITNATSLLRQSNATAAEKSAGKQAAGLAELPEVFSTKIAGDTYRVFIHAVQPPYGTYLQQEDGSALRQERLFLVGLKREDLRAELASSMEPGGRFLLTVLTLLAFLIWPLATVRSKSPDDPIAWSEAVACLAAVVLIPAVLAIATVWVWSYQGLLAWVDAGAARYAHAVAATLERQLQEGREVLAQYRPLYRHNLDNVEPAEVAIRARKDGGFVTGRVGPSSCRKQPDRTCIVEGASDGAGEWRAWSTFSSVFATDARGARDGVRFTVYDPPLVKSDASYDNREYFRALQKNQGWVPDSTARKEESYVAQRIYSGSDGARVLQMAVPRLEASDCAAEFCGIITGSASLHSLAAAVSPPLLNFAVIDRNSGMVVFHSNDSRSLAESFFVETERNPQLLALSAVAQSGFFSGRYVGAGYRFFHLPMQDTPWSVVVFFSLKEVGDLPWHAVFTALAAYAGALLVLLTASCLAIWLWAKRSRKSALNIAAGFWMRGGSSCSYSQWGLALFAIGLTMVTLYELWADSQLSLITYIMWAVLVLAAGAVWLQHKFAIHSVCMALWLLLISALPAAWMALGYHDVQVQGLRRDGLFNAARDIQRRTAVIANDLQRWLSAAEGRDKNFPKESQITRPSAVIPVPGYSAGSCGGAMAAGKENIWAMCMFDAPPLATLITRRELDFWRRETWDASVQAETQQRRIRLLGQMDVAHPRCESKGATEECVFQTSDAQEFTVRAEAAPAKSAAASKDDDRRFAGVVGLLGSVLSPLLAILITWMLSLFISRRLLGERSSVHAHGTEVVAPSNTHHGVVFHTRRIPSEEVDRLLRGLRHSGTGGSTTVTRVNLATKALYNELGPERVLEGRVLLTNLDIALADADRRRDILDALERLVENPRVQLLILCRRSPIERLYHPERYPESGVGHVLALDESLRWDNVLQKFECRDVENMDAPRTHPHLATVDHHRTWKLCTRSERLLLYELARGRLANPRNVAVIDGLVARGLLKLDPWPKIADESFETFVRTAETTDDVVQWQQDAAQNSGRRVRSTIIAILLIALLLAVVWFSWSAGDKFKIVSAIVAGAVAFLGQIGQAFNFVRSGAGSTGRS